MGENNVRTLEVVPPEKRRVVQVVELLESLLASAKEGKIYSLVVVSEGQEHYATEWAGVGDVAKRIGMAQLAVLNAAGVQRKDG